MKGKDFYIRWMGQAGYILTLDDRQICIDLYLSCSVEREEGLKRLIPVPVEPSSLEADWFIVTHDHLDHLDPDTISGLKSNKIHFAGPDSCLRKLKGLGIEDHRCFSLNRGEFININSIYVWGVYAQHTDDSIGVVLRYGNITIYFTGDTLYTPKLLLAKKYNPDILVTCINGQWGNMGAKEAARLAESLGVKVAIPSHYGMFAENTEDPEKLRDELVQKRIKYRELIFNKDISVINILKEL